MKYKIGLTMLVLGFSLLNAQSDDTRWIASNHVIKDSNLGLMWQDTRTVRLQTKTWHEAKNYCADLKLAQKYNWRLPTLDELLSIVDYEEYSPAIVDTFNFTDKKGYYWTSSNVSTDKRYAWYISFDKGNTYAYSKEEAVYVRCVRDDI